MKMNLKIMTYQVPPYGGSAINTQRRGRADGERYQCLVPGNEKKLEKMKNWYWLKNVGSPRSRILIKCEIKNIQKQVERGIVGFKHNRKIPLCCSPDNCTCSIL